MKEFKTATIKPYDFHSADKAFEVLFTQGLAQGNGLKEIPADSYQLVVAALEYILWDVTGEDHTTIKKAVSICQRLRDQQKRREWKRKVKEEN